MFANVPLSIVRLSVGSTVVMVAGASSMYTLWSVRLDKPWFFIVTITESAGFVVNAVLVIVACSTLSMSPIDNPPIQLAVTIATAMTTAMSTIDAITGLSALLFRTWLGVAFLV
jgi:hypothetical protein